MRAFLDEALPSLDSFLDADVPGGDDFDEATAFNKQLAAKRWIAPDWPKQYGGIGAPIDQQMDFDEELAYYGAPDNGTRGLRPPQD